MSSTLAHEIPELLETGEVLSWIRDVSGADLVFPGHPVVIACAIMALYGSLTQVTAGTEFGSKEALSDGRVPGTGDCVRVALHALQSGGSEIEMLDEMRRYWSRSQAGGHMGNVDPGIAQAMKLEPYFRENVGPWLAANPAQRKSTLMEKAEYLPAELGALATEVAAAIRAAGVKDPEHGVAEILENCILISKDDQAGKHRALQTASMSLYGILKGLAICDVITNLQLMNFTAVIFTPKSAAQS